MTVMENDPTPQASPPPPAKPPVALASVSNALSGDRLRAYSVPDEDKDSTDAIARYLWNGSLCIDFHATLHTLEVAFRNTVFRHTQACVNTSTRYTGTFRCWLTAKPTFLFPVEERHVAEAVQRVSESYPNPRYHSPGRLIAKLGFGFWTGLLQAPYDHSRADGPKLWPHLLKSVFPYAPKGLNTRSAISAELDAIRDFRNRIAHHEPIWDRKPLQMHSRILHAIGWMYPDVAVAIRTISEVPATIKKGPSFYRQFAAQMLGVPHPPV